MWVPSFILSATIKTNSGKKVLNQGCVLRCKRCCKSVGENISKKHLLVLGHFFFYFAENNEKKVFLNDNIFEFNQR
jgi:hypothetical protein